MDKIHFADNWYMICCFQDLASLKTSLDPFGKIQDVQRASGESEIHIHILWPILFLIALLNKVSLRPKEELDHIADLYKDYEKR